MIPQFFKSEPRAFNRSLAEHRKRVSGVSFELPPASGVHIVEDFLRIYKDVKIPIWIFRPEEIDPPYPTLLYIPGTAFIAQELDVTYGICSHIAKLAKCQVVVINHRLAPENQFPKGLIDAMSIIKFILLGDPKLLKLDINNIVLAGYSSGGNFAAQIALRPELPIRCQILASPIVDLSRSLTKYGEFEREDKVITEEFVKWFLHLYIPEGANLDDPLLSPYYQNILNPTKLAPTYIIFGEKDRFRSDAEAYVKKLEEAGAPVKRKIFKNSDHLFLWYQYEAVELIAKLIKHTVSTPLEKPLLHQQVVIKPTSLKFLEHIKQNKGQQEENSSSQQAPFIQSRL